MKSVFEPDTQSEILRRLARIKPDLQPQWGKMNVSQMLAHCAVPIEGMLGYIAVREPVNWFVKLFFKSYLYNDRPYSKGLPTAKSFVIKDQPEFNDVHTRLIDLVTEVFTVGPQGPWAKHPSFGRFTGDQIGMVIYKHLDHHFRQFGV